MRQCIKLHRLSFRQSNLSIIFRHEKDCLHGPTESHKKIFEPFFRWDKKGQIKGSGIGLSVSHSLTEMHGGALTYSITEEKYNCFEFILP
ncbi:sensor histidine kinase, partial [Arachidicoccus sp.]|uniref:sensor histidine kinase n=1 Tax=Arachidicoccus sp. TaxID=1872624 RepID=UPI003D1BC6A5